MVFRSRSRLHLINNIGTLCILTKLKSDELFKRINDASQQRRPQDFRSTEEYIFYISLKFAIFSTSAAGSWRYPPPNYSASGNAQKSQKFFNYVRNPFKSLFLSRNSRLSWWNQKNWVNFKLFHASTMEPSLVIVAKIVL